MSNSSDSSPKGSCGFPTPPSTPPKETSIPYVVGTSLIAKGHTPPEPGGEYDWMYDYPRDSREVKRALQKATQLEWVLSHSPTPGHTHTDDTRCIRFARSIRTGQQCNAQVLLTDDGLVAKIYDPMFYAWTDEDFPDIHNNVSRKADQAYINEVAAYRELAGTQFSGTLMPLFFGSYALDIPVVVDGKHKTREVRMVLLEYIPGRCMLDIDPEQLPPRARENIMFKLIEADTDLNWFGGVNHNDVYPRNVILSGDDYESPALRFCLIDFDVAIICRIERGTSTELTHVNPLMQWYPQDLWSQWRWLPEKKEAQAWMWETWADGRGGKYDSVMVDPNCKYGWLTFVVDEETRVSKAARGVAMDNCDTSDPVQLQAGSRALGDGFDRAASESGGETGERQERIDEYPEAAGEGTPRKASLQEPFNDHAAGGDKSDRSHDSGYGGSCQTSFDDQPNEDNNVSHSQAIGSADQPAHKPANENENEETCEPSSHEGETAQHCGPFHEAIPYRGPENNKGSETGIDATKRVPTPPGDERVKRIRLDSDASD